MPPTSARQPWIDLLRGLAVSGMVWTHSANTFLDASLQATPGYATLSFYHGLVAPTFFWLAGFMRGLAASRPGPSKPLRPTVVRLIGIWAFGHVMHIPWEAFANLDFSPPALRVLFQCDVLQCLAVSCLILIAVERLIPQLLHRRLIVLMAGLACVVVTPWMASVITGLPWFDAYLGKQNGSLFPLFPWFGFAAAGFLCGSPWRPSRRLAAAALIMAFGVPWTIGNSTTLLFFGQRLGWVIGLALIVSRIPSNSRTLDWLLLAGRESLLVYVVHLFLIHAVPWWGGSTPDRGIGPTQSPLHVLLLFVGLLSVSLALAFANEQRKARARNVV